MPEEYSDETLKELGKLALKVANNPKTRRPFLKAVKEIDPDKRFPDQDVEDLREQLVEEREADKAERERERVQARLESQRAGLADRYSEEQIKEIETKVMQKFGLADYEAAAKIYGSDLPPSVPSHGSPRPSANWQLPDFEGLHKDPAKAAREMAFKVIDEMRMPGGKR